MLDYVQQEFPVKKIVKKAKKLDHQIHKMNFAKSVERMRSFIQRRNLENILILEN